MRLVCPNCDAQYEVSDDAIPEGGRDVQCSNCGHAWFQASPLAEAEQVAEEELFEAPDVVAAGPGLIAPPEVSAPPAAAPPPVPVAVEAPVEMPAEEPDDLPAFEEPAPLQRRSLDESLMAVLREEAEREVQVRRAEDPQPIETQPDLGLEETVATVSPVARRIAQLKGIDLDAPIARPATRLEMLPDIEEINSTLRASSERREDPDEMIESLPDLTKPRRSAFSSGFVIMVSLAVLVAAAYILAPKIIEQIPGSKSAMTAYVAAVDHARAYLDVLMKKAIGALQGVGGNAG